MKWSKVGICGHHEQRDFQRFLKKHDLPEWCGGPLRMPEECQHLRRLKLKNVLPHQESVVLEDLARDFERQGNYFQARNALLDRYLFDPSDSGLFARIKEMEKRPLFREQLGADLERRGKKAGTINTVQHEQKGDWR